MGLEVANLTAKINFDSRGEAQATRALKSVQQAVEALGGSLEQMSAKSATADAAVRVTTSKLEARTRAFEEAQKAVENFASGLKELQQEEKKYQDLIDSANDRGANINEIQGLKSTQAAIQQNIAEYGTLEQTLERATNAEGRLVTATNQQLSALDRQAAAVGVSRSELQSYENQLTIATATTATFAEAQMAAIAEIQRLDAAGQDTSAMLQTYTALLDAEANSVTQASERTQGWATQLEDLAEALKSAEGAETAGIQAAMGHAKAALEASAAADKEADSQRQLAAAIKVATAERNAAKSSIGAGQGGAEKLGIAEKAIDSLTGKSAASAGREAGQLDKMGKASDRLGRALQSVGPNAAKAGSKIQGMVRNVSGLAGAARGGITGLSQMATSLGRLGPIAVAAGIALFAVFKIAKAFAAFSASSHLTGNVTEEMVALGKQANITATEMAGLATGVQNFFRGIDVTNAEAATEAMIEQGIALKNLHDSGTAGGAINAIQQIVSGNVEMATSLGLSKSGFIAVENNLKSYASEAEKVAARQQELNRQLALGANQERLDIANQNDVAGIEDLTFATREFFDELARELAPAIQAIIDLLGVLVTLARPLIVAINAIAQAIVLVVKVTDDMVKSGTRLLLNFFKPFLDLARHLPGVGDDIGRMADELNAWANGAEQAASANNDLQLATQETALSADKAREAYRSYLDVVGQGRGAVSAVRALGDALNELDADPTPANALKAVEAFENVYRVAVEGGRDALQAVRDFADGLNLGAEAEQFIDQILSMTDDALKPADENLEAVGVQAEQVKGPVDSAAGAFGNLGSMAGGAVGPIDAMRGSLENLSGVYPVVIPVTVTGNGAGLLGGGGLGVIGGGGGAFPTARVPYSNTNNPVGAESSSSTGSLQTGGVSTAQRVADGAARRAATGRSGSGSRADQQARDAERANNQRVQDASTALADYIGGSGGGGGGGGGGGPDKSKDLSIEEIRKFLNEVNKAITAGIRGGIVFSTAGNAIPTGGPGEFVKNEGGVNIGTVNLRGVWDFADPAAKREIVRQLQEALAQYEKEVS